MADEKYPITYNREYYAVMANDVIHGKQEMTLQEAKLIRLLITQVVKQDHDLKTYVCRIQDLAHFLNIDDSNLYRDIKKICENLLQRIVRIGTGNPKQPWQAFQWVSKASYDGNGNVTLMLSEQLKPYVLQLEKWFTQYQLENILEMQSFYAIRFYELLKCQDGLYGNKRESFEFTIDYLREYFSCEGKYSLFADFKRKVINIAISEINAKSDLEIPLHTLTYKKEGRKVVAIQFQVFWNVQTEKKRHPEKFGHLIDQSYRKKAFSLASENK